MLFLPKKETMRLIHGKKKNKKLTWVIGAPFIQNGKRQRGGKLTYLGWAGNSFDE